MPASRGFMLYVSAAVVGILGLGQPGPAVATDAANAGAGAASASSPVTTVAAAAATATITAGDEALARATASSIAAEAAEASSSTLFSETTSVVVTPSYSTTPVSSSSAPRSPSSSSPSSSSSSSSVSADTGTCQFKTINYLTHTLPQQCLWTSWTAANATAAPAVDPGHTASGEAPSTTASATTTATTTATASATATTVEAEKSSGSSDDDSQEDLATNSFMSFEEWKVLQLKKAGQDPADLQVRRRQQQQQQQQQRQRQRQQHNAGGDSSVDSLGDDGEIALDFDVLNEKVSELAGSATAGAHGQHQQQQHQQKQNSGNDDAGAETDGGGGGDGSSGGGGGAPAGGDRPEDALLYADGSAQYYRSKDAGKTSKERFSFASFDAGATVLKTNKGAKNSKAILVENKDSYMLLECGTRDKYVVVELSDDILVDTVVLANFEFFSSMVRRFRVSVSDRYPAKADRWKVLGEFEARNARDIQPFLIEHPQIWAKYLRVDFLSHYGNEYYCPLSLLRVHGTRMLDSWKDSENGQEDEEEDGDGRKDDDSQRQQQEQEQAAVEAEAEQQRRQDEQRQSEQQQQRQRQQQQDQQREAEAQHAERQAEASASVDTAQQIEAASNGTSPWDPLSWQSTILFVPADAQCSASSATSSENTKPAVSSQTPVVARGSQDAANSSGPATPDEKSTPSSFPLVSSMTAQKQTPAASSADPAVHTQASQAQQSPQNSNVPNSAKVAAAAVASSSSSASPSSATASSAQSEAHAPPPASGSTAGSGSEPGSGSSSSSSTATPNASQAVSPSSGASAATGSADAATTANGENGTKASSPLSSSASSSSHPPPSSSSSSFSSSSSSSSVPPSPPPPPPPPPPAVSPPVQESFFKSITKRLQLLESNTSLSLQYIEDQSRFLQDALRKMERKQISRVDTFLDTLNQTVLAELRFMRQQYDQIWQSTVLALETQREQSQRETVALSDRLNVLADEVVFQKRMAILQSVLLLCCLALVIFSRGLLTATASVVGGGGGGGTTATAAAAAAADREEVYYALRAASPASRASSPDYHHLQPYRNDEPLLSSPFASPDLQQQHQQQQQHVDTNKVLPMTPLTPTTPTLSMEPDDAGSPEPSSSVATPDIAADPLDAPRFPRLDKIVEETADPASQEDHPPSVIHHSRDERENGTDASSVSGLGLSFPAPLPSLPEDHPS